MRSIEPAAASFLFVLCILVPYAAFQSRRQLGDGPLPVSRTRLFAQTIFVQLWLFALAAFTAVRNGIDLLAAPRRPLLAWSLAAIFLIGLLAVLRWRWPHRDPASKARLYRMLPRDRRELAPYYAVCVIAGVCEEVVYRGAAAMLLARITGSVIAAVLIASVLFALAHVVQGWRSAGVIFVIALGAHALVIIGQSLFPVMVAHALYDAVAGTLMPRWHARDSDTIGALAVLSQPILMR
jgi:membrane protease YdiL (CAAX protease family)